MNNLTDTIIILLIILYIFTIYLYIYIIYTILAKMCGERG